MAERTAGLAARTKKASKGDGRTGVEQARREEQAPPFTLPNWDVVKERLIKRGVMMPRDPMPQDYDPPAKPQTGPQDD